MNKKLFICNTYYHIFISIVKTLVDGSNSTVILSTDNRNTKLARDSNLIERLNKSKMFDEIIIFDHSEEEEIIRNKFLSPIHRLIFTHKSVKNNKINFNDYNEICIFYDNCLIGRIVNNYRIKYTLLEDGQDCFKSKNKNRLYKKTNLKKIIKYILNYRELGKAKYVNKIIVNNKDDLCIKHKNIIEEPKKELFNKLSLHDKNRIFSLFLNKKDFSYLDNSNLIITQPFYDDKLLNSCDEQIEMYKEIIEKYTDKKKIIIKTHPRETIDYMKYFDNYEVMNEPFPLEIITFLDSIKFKKIITVSSTSIYSFENSSDIVMLGWDWLNEYKSHKNKER